MRLTKLFREQYLSEKGIDVRFRLTFAGSGVQVGEARVQLEPQRRVGLLLMRPSHTARLSCAC